MTHDEIMRCYANMLLQSSAFVLDAKVQKPPHWLKCRKFQTESNQQSYSYEETVLRFTPV